MLDHWYRTPIDAKFLLIGIPHSLSTFCVEKKSMGGGGQKSAMPSMLEILLLEWNFLRISPSSLSYHFCAYEPHADFSAWTGPLQGRFSYRTCCPSVVLQWRAYQIWTIFNAEYSTYSGERKRETDTFLIRESLWTALKKSYAHSPALSPTLSLSL